MKHLGICTGLAVLIVFCSEIPVEGRGKKASGSVTGRIAAVNPGSITIAKGKQSRKKRARAYTLGLAQQTVLVGPDGRPAPINALQPGVRVRVAYQVAGTGTPVATQIQLLGR